MSFLSNKNFNLPKIFNFVCYYDEVVCNEQIKTLCRHYVESNLEKLEKTSYFLKTRTVLVLHHENVLYIFKKT